MENETIVEYVTLKNEKTAASVWTLLKKIPRLKR